MPHKRLYRNTKERILGGVCSGLADYFNIDPTLMRLIYLAVTLLTGGAFVILYLILWIIMPEPPYQKVPYDNDHPST